MHVSATQIFRRHFLARGRFHQWWPSQKDRTLLFHNNAFIGHGRNVSTTGGTRPHYHRNLRNAFGRHVGLIKENSAEMLAIGKHIILAR